MVPGICRMQESNRMDAEKEPIIASIRRISLQPSMDKESDLKTTQIQQVITRHR